MVNDKNLIVTTESKEEMREQLTTYLQDHGYTVYVYESSKEK